MNADNSSVSGNDTFVAQIDFLRFCRYAGFAGKGWSQCQFLHISIKTENYRVPLNKTD